METNICHYRRAYNCCVKQTVCSSDISLIRKTECPSEFSKENERSSFHQRCVYRRHVYSSCSLLLTCIYVRSATILLSPAVRYCSNRHGSALTSA